MTDIELLHQTHPKLFVLSTQEPDLKLDPENDNGPIEYKRTLSECDETRAQKYATQMLWRLGQNVKGLATYYIGVDDDGTICGLTTDEILEAIDWLTKIAQIIGASIIKVEVIDCGERKILRVVVKMKKISDGYADFDF